MYNWIIHPIGVKMDNKVLAILVVVALVAVSAGTIFMLNNTADEAGAETGRLVVYGNANNDDYLDKHDIDFINSIISKETSWDKAKNPYADTNNDNKIDNKDVELLQKFINKEKSVMKYKDVWGGVSSINYPISGSIGTMYWEQADLAILLGLWDRVSACGYGSLNEDKNPGWESLYSYGKGYNADVEVVLSSNVSALIAYTQGDGTALAIKDAIESSGSSMNMIAAPNQDKLTCVITSGVLLSCEKRAYEYVKDCDDAVKYAEEKLSGISAEKAPRVLVCMVKTTSNNGDILVLGKSPTSSNGLYTYMMKTPAVILQPENASGYYTSVTSEWVMEQDPDYILFVGSGLWSSTATESEIQEVFESKTKELFGGTNAYKNQKIFATANGTMGSYFNGLAFLTVAGTVFDEIEDSVADKYWNYWTDKNFALYEFEDVPSYKVRGLSS